MIAILQAENAKISAALRVHDQLVQALRIAKLQKQAFGASSEKIEREIEQLELALEDLLVAVAEAEDAPLDEDEAVFCCIGVGWESTLPPLRKDGAGARTQPPDSGQHGGVQSTGACVGLEI